MPMSILALDLGSQRVGVAVSDELNLIAHPMGRISFGQKTLFFKRLTEIIEERKVREVVVGLPVNMNGSLGAKAKETLEIVEQMRELLKIPVHLFDERLTTKQGERLLIEMDRSRKARKRAIDSFSAQILLQDYLDRLRKDNA